MSTNGLTDEQTRTGLKNVMRMGMAGQAMGTLTGGVFLVKVALIFGAPLFVFGLLAALPALAQMVQVPSAYLIERYRERKKVALVAFAGIRACVLLIALITLLFSAEVGLTLLLSVILLQGVFSATGGTAWNSWMRDLVPQERMGAFFSRRQRYTVALSIPLSLLAGWFVSRWAARFPSRELEGYTILFSLGFAAGLFSLYFIWRTPEPAMPALEGTTEFVELIARPFRDENFRRLIGFLASWNFAIGLASPFFTVYMLSRLGFDMSVVIALTVLSQASNVAFVQIWGRLSDSFSNKAVLQVSGPLVLVSVLLWLFTAMPDPYRLTVPLLVVIHVLLGMSMAGVTLTTGNIGLKLAPQGRATSYLAANSLVGSLAAGVAPVVGGVVANSLAVYEFSIVVNWEGPGGLFSVPAFYLTGMDFAFILAFLVGLYAMHRLSLVVEEGQFERSSVVNSLLAEIKRPVVTFTNETGVSELIDRPLGLVRRRGRRRRSRPDDSGG